MKFRKCLGLILMLGAISSAYAGKLDKAKELFQAYTAQAAAYDPSLADLYSESAVIKNKRIYPDGQVRELNIPAPQFKSLVRSAMPLAKARNDVNKYANVSYAMEGANVRITATRFSALKNYASPVSILVGPDRQGQWLIFEELSESRP